MKKLYFLRMVLSMVKDVVITIEETQLIRCRCTKASLLLQNHDVFRQNHFWIDERGPLVLPPIQEKTKQHCGIVGIINSPVRIAFKLNIIIRQSLLQPDRLI